MMRRQSGVRLPLAGLGLNRSFGAAGIDQRSAVNDKEMVALATEFAELAAEVHGGGDNNSALLRVVQQVVMHVDGCSWASVTEIRNGEGKSLVSSDPIAAQVDLIQHGLGEGPCMQAADDDSNYLLFDVIDEPRWPAFAAAAARDTPLRCVLAIRLPGGQAAALNLYADRPDAFDDEAVGVATVFAAHAAGLVAIVEAQSQNHNLEAALQSSRQIGMAMGILMAHHKITEQDAFALLRIASQNLHRKLRDIALDVTETGALPELTPVRTAEISPSSVKRPRFTPNEGSIGPTGPAAPIGPIGPIGPIEPTGPTELLNPA
jgi:hypothetical protein